MTQGESLIAEILAEPLKYTVALDRFRRRLIESALNLNRGNRTHAAEMLGMDRSNLRGLMKRLGIDID